MSIVDINEMSDVGLVAQYVIEMLERGHFLSREDYSKIQLWLSMSTSTDDLLLILEDVISRKIEKSKSKGKRVFSLASINKTVERKIAERSRLVQGVSHCE